MQIDNNMFVQPILGISTLMGLEKFRNITEQDFKFNNSREYIDNPSNINQSPLNITKHDFYSTLNGFNDENIIKDSVLVDNVIDEIELYKMSILHKECYHDNECNNIPNSKYQYKCLLCLNYSSSLILNVGNEIYNPCGSKDFISDNGKKKKNIIDGGVCVPMALVDGHDKFNCNPAYSDAVIVVKTESISTYFFPGYDDINRLHVQWRCISKYPNLLKVNERNGEITEIACGDRGYLVNKFDSNIKFIDSLKANKNFQISDAVCKCEHTGFPLSGGGREITYWSISNRQSCSTISAINTIEHYGILTSCLPGVIDAGSKNFSCACPDGYISCPQLNIFDEYFHKKHCYGAFLAALNNTPSPICIKDMCAPYGKFNIDSKTCTGLTTDDYIYFNNQTPNDPLENNEWGLVLRKGQAHIFGTGNASLWDAYNFHQ